MGITLDLASIWHVRYSSLDHSPLGHPHVGLLSRLAVIPLFVFFATFVLYHLVLFINTSRTFKMVPTVPYWVPYLGSAMSLMGNPAEFFLSVAKRFGYARPLGIRVAFLDLVLVSNPEQIQQLFRNSSSLSPRLSLNFALRYLFRMPAAVLPLYFQDNIPITTKSDDGSSKVQLENQIHLQAHNFHKLLSGRNLVDLNHRYLAALERTLGSLEVSHEWSTIPDLYAFLQDTVAASSIETVLGSKILELNPNLVEDLWQFQAGVPKLLRLYPRWLVPQVYAARDRLINSIRSWHSHVDSCMKSVSGTWSPNLGASVVEKRYEDFSKIPWMTADARASDDLGFLFSLNANVVPASFWYIFEALKSPKVRSQMNKEVALSSHGGQEINIDKLLTQPLLQSTYAEVLRLYVVTFLTRTVESPDNHGLNIGGYSIPNGKHIVVPSNISSYNAEVWTRTRPETTMAKPLTEFDAERFLTQNSPRPSEDTGSSNAKPFSMKGLTNLWLPYGGGDCICPGRFFAKGQMLLTYALIFSHYDVELIDTTTAVQPDTRFAPFGSLPPASRVPFRIRKKVT
ncbi:cytochrome P450 [Rhypophila decipiens]|uniref:Cytochrome P450 n=1 Tax=Rhypophila decipiens TaxID=261697 RepID=A0AAN7B0J1_9PEZI|nr:cytochrome P450 [Rhypophila decipiens]